MKIRELSDRQMILKDSNIAGFASGAFALAIGIFVFFKVLPLAPGEDAKIIVVPAAFTIIGLVFLLLVRATSVLFDKNGNAMTVTRTGVLGRKRQQYALNQVQRIELREEVTMVNRGYNRPGGMAAGGVYQTPQLNYQVVCVLATGEEIPLEHVKTPGTAVNGVLMGGVGSDRTNGQRIASFLGVPYQEATPFGAAGPTPPNAVS